MVERRSELQPDDRRLFEACLGEDFASVRLVGRPHALERRFASGVVLGTCHDNDVYVRPGLPKHLRLAALGHELAHVVQNRNALRHRQGCASPADLEGEAHRAAMACVLGQRFRCRLSDGAGVARAWGEAGHYYTVLYVMLAAGADPDLASGVAFLTQMPDQVTELDAYSAGKNLFFGADRKVDYDLVIQKGLHCLNGGDAGTETTRRRAVLVKYPFRSFEFCFGMHAFGDSYAHRMMNNQSVLYDAGAGHAFDKNKPDTVSERPDLYLKYVLDLFQTVAGKLVNVPRRLEQAPLMEEARRFTQVGRDQDLIVYIRGSMMRLLQQPPETYMPETEGTHPWKDFRQRHGLPPFYVSEAVRLAYFWSSPGPLS